MNECTVCGADVPEGQYRCPNGHYVVAACVFCGFERPRNQPVCPRCGHQWPWSAETETTQAPQLADPRTPKRPRPSDADLTAATMRRPWRSAEEEEEEEARIIDLRDSAILRHTDRWWQIGRYVAIAIVAVGLVGIASYVFGEWGSRAGESIPTVAAITSNSGIVTTIPATSAQVSVAATSATAPTTTVPTTTTTLFVTPVGDAIPVNDLRLTIYGIGDLKIGEPADQVAGALAATFGQPDFAEPVEPSDAHPGACPGSTSIAMRWGILEISLSDGSFAGYRLDSSLGAADSATAELRTASGLRVGATVSTLQTIYESYHIVFEDRPGFGQVFSLQRTNGEELLWGPVSSAERDGTVLGIYSPSGC